MLRSLLLLLLLGAASGARAQDWQLVWSDEFDTPGAPDPTKWNYDIGGSGWGNQELQYYTDRTDNARVEGGLLVIEARKEDLNGNAYTSARLVTRGTAAWTYGRIEARMKLPFGQGIWPAFWMLPTNSPYGGWPTSGEIDIMEFLGHDTDRVYGTLHYGGGSLGHVFTGTNYTLSTGTFVDDFHTFSIEWGPRQVRWYVDGALYQTQTNWSSGAGPYPAPFDRPFHILLNLAVGGQWPGYPDATTTFPQRMEVDYVRVYQDAEAYPTVSLDGPVGGTTFETGATVSLLATASDNDAIDEVRFFQGDGVLGADIFVPYGLNVAGVVDGCYSLRVQATNAVGYVTLSDPVDVTVGAGCPPGSTAPYLMRPAAVPGVVEAEYYDLGGSEVAYRDLGETNTGSGIRQGEGVDVRPSLDAGGGFDVTDVTAREWLTYTVDVAEAGRYRVQARVASGTGGTLRLSVDGTDLLGDVVLSPTSSDASYANAFLGNVDLAAGRHTIRLDMRSAGFSLNHLRFTFLGATAEEGGGDLGLGLRLAPNPSTGSAEIVYRVPEAGLVDVSVFDVVGRRVAVVTSTLVAAGEHRVTLDVRDFAPGVYTCVLKTAAGVRLERLSVVR